LAAVVAGLNPAVESPASQALATDAQPRKLRVGLFAGAPLQPRWLVEAFARVAASDFAEIAVIGIVDGGRKATTPWPWKLYGALDRKLFRAGDPDAPLELAKHVSHQEFNLQSADVTPFLALDLDVAFALGDFDDRVLDGIAHYGVWRLQADGAREVVRGEPLTGSSLLVRLVPGAEPKLAYQSWARTCPFSVARNREQLLAKTAEFAWRGLREAQRSGIGWLEQCKSLGIRGRSPNQFGDGALTPASPLPMLKNVAARAIERALHREQWFMAYKFNGGSNGNGAVPPDLEGFTRLVPPADRTWADPFPLEHGGRHYVFFEELPFAAGKAHISVMEIGADGRWSAPERVLERDYHLSYPFVFEHEGRLYMIPETAQNGTVELWRCEEFPRRWRLEKVLLEGVRLVDATLYRAAERWWMFANGAAGASRAFDDELHLFHSESLLGEWQPHPRNPVKSDVRGARPAGRLFWRAGALHRPAQICAPVYGAGLSINRVLRLTPQDYVERQVERILPDRGRGLLGLHTLNRAGALTVVDAFTRRRRLA
jgi:hypothetical protein